MAPVTATDDNNDRNTVVSMQMDGGSMKEVSAKPEQHLPGQHTVSEQRTAPFAKSPRLNAAPETAIHAETDHVNAHGSGSVDAHSVGHSPITQGTAPRPYAAGVAPDGENVLCHLVVVAPHVVRVGLRLVAAPKEDHREQETHHDADRPVGLSTTRRGSLGARRRLTLHHLFSISLSRR